MSPPPQPGPSFSIQRSEAHNAPGPPAIRAGRSTIRHARHAYVRGGMRAATTSSVWLKRTTSERVVA
jgi:hypothetical protein